MFGKLFLFAFLAVAYGRPDDRRYEPSDQCPAGIHRLLPHEYDCTLFYYCEYGMKWIEPRRCARGTEFSEELQVCVHPVLANCNLPGPPIEGAPTETTEASITTALPVITTEAPITTVRPNITTEAPITTVRPDITTEAPITTVRPNITTEAPITTVRPDITTEAPITTVRPNITTEAPITTVRPDITTEAPITTVRPNITTEAPITTVRPDITTEAPITTVRPNITTEAPITTVRPDITTEAPITTVRPNITTEAPITTVRPDITTEASITTVRPNITTEAPITTVRPDITTEAPITTVRPNITTEAPITTVRPDITTEAPITTVRPNITTEAPITTVRPDITTEAPITTVRPNITTEVPITTVRPDITTEAPITTVRPNITTEVPITTALPDITTSTSTFAPETTEPGPIELLPNGCPADFHIHQLLPHESDCTKFYYCNFGELVERTCGDGTAFNPALQVCDHLENVECKNKNESEEDVDGSGFGSDEEIDASGDYTDVDIVIVDGSGDGDLPNGCPSDFEEHRLLAHETDCSKFYYCIFGEKIERSCASGTHFDVELQVCDHPDKVGCAVTNPGSDEDKETSSEDSVEWLENGCPADSTHINQLLPHHDCGKFYQCVHGNKIEMSCPPGLHFSPSLNQCDYPAYAGCESGNGDGNGEDGGNGGEDGGNGEVEVLPNGCPADFNNEQLLPSADCSKYYQCVHGNKVERPCSPGLHFNPNTQQCDFPEFAGCESGNGGGSGDGGNGNGEDGGNGGEDGGNGEVEVLPNGCPADYTNEQLLPSADCTKYYQCVHGHKVERPCPTGLHFNPKTQQCDFPEFAGCESGNGGGSGDGGNGNGEDGGHGEVEVLPNGCPADYTNEQLLPSADCSKYYQCVHGHKVERPCSPGLHFNPNTQQCDFPEFAGCESGNGGGSGDGGNGNGEDGGNGGEDGGHGEVEVLPNGCPADYTNEQLLPSADCSKYYQCVHGNKVKRRCPTGLHFNPSTQQCDFPEFAGCESNNGGGDNGGHGEVEVLPNGCPADYTIEQLLPSADCNKYYQCVHGIKVKRRCPTGLHFNPSTQQCDYPDVAGCESGSGNGNGEDGGNGGEDGDNDGSGDNGGNGEVEVLPNGCPADYTNEQLLPSSDCRKYYQCVHGHKVKRRCSTGLHFNPSTQQCDYPEFAGCESGNGGEDGGNGGEDGGNGGEDGGNGGEDGGNGGEDGDNGGEDGGNGGEDGGNGGEDGGNGGEDGSDDRCMKACNIPPWSHAHCNKYWHCDGVNAALVTCSEGLHFNADTLTCDLISNANCRKRFKHQNVPLIQLFNARLR